MKISIIIPPCREIATSYPPYGALYIGSWLKANGYEVSLCNMDIDRSLKTKDAVEFVEKEKPDILGFSAIVSTTYGYVKEMSHAIRDRFPEMKQIMGGQLSQAAKIVLDNTSIDVIVIGEGEVTTLKLIEAFQNGNDISTVNGIAYKKENEVVFTPSGDQIRNMDVLPTPDWEMIDMDKYLLTADERFGSFLKSGAKFLPSFYDEHRKGKKAFTLMTGRGCSDWCTFCSRNMKGLRKHTADYLLDLIEELQEKFNVGYFTFGDESFVASKPWVYTFLEKLKERKLDIQMYVLGVRVDTVDYDLLKALKEGGCFMIEYGFEHGSQRMLDVMEKRATVAENYRVYHWTRELGLFTVPSNVINMPGETSDSIKESIEFLKSLNTDIYFVNYAQAHPGTPLYDYALLKGLIPDEEKYLIDLNDVNAADAEKAMEKGVLINFSELPMKEVLSWQYQFHHEIQKNKEGRSSRFILRIYNEVKKVRQLGIKDFIPYFSKRVYFGLKRVITAIELSLKSYYLSKSKFGEVSILNQFELTDQKLIMHIKRMKYESRETIPHEANPHIQYYVDNYGSGSLIRHPSLREIVGNVKSSLKENENVRMTDTKKWMLKEVHMKPYSLQGNVLETNPS